MRILTLEGKKHTHLIYSFALFFTNEKAQTPREQGLSRAVASWRPNKDLEAECQNHTDLPFFIYFYCILVNMFLMQKSKKCKERHSKANWGRTDYHKKTMIRYPFLQDQSFIHDLFWDTEHTFKDTLIFLIIYRIFPCQALLFLI